MFIGGVYMSNKGFTLVELLAVLVILGFIAVIAIPSINSSMSRTREKQNAQRIELILSSARDYVVDHKNHIYQVVDVGEACYIKIDDLINEGYLSEELIQNMKNDNFDGVIQYIKGSSSNGALDEYKYVKKNNIDSDKSYCSE